MAGFQRQQVTIAVRRLLARQVLCLHILHGQGLYFSIFLNSRE